jgi:hypothetical protein
VEIYCTVFFAWTGWIQAKTYRDWHANVPLLQKSGLPDGRRGPFEHHAAGGVRQDQVRQAPHLGQYAEILLFPSSATASGGTTIDAER